MKKMFFFAVTIALLAVVSKCVAWEDPTENDVPLHCGAPNASKFERNDILHRIAAQPPQHGYQLVEIPVHIHVFHYHSSGRITASQIGDQIQVLNDAFSGAVDSKQGVDSGIRFTLAQIFYIEDVQMYTKCNTLKADIYKQVQDTSVLNIATCSGQGFLGWTFSPWNFPEDSNRHVVFLNWRTIPRASNSLSRYNHGFSAVHEVGHWFGLLHTFGNGGCNEDEGDQVPDTPLERIPQTDCVHTRDSCPDSPGRDPSWSFMDYTPDTCMMRFSEGQIMRMRSMLALHKPLLLTRFQQMPDTLSPTASPVLDCSQFTCGVLCTAPCGWSRKKNICVFGGVTKPRELDLGPGCTTVAPSTSKPTTLSPTETPTKAPTSTPTEFVFTKKYCKSKTCGKDCTKPCGWSTMRGKCVLNGHTTERELSAGSDCPDVRVADKTEDQAAVDREAADLDPILPLDCANLGWRVNVPFGACGASRISGVCYTAVSFDRAKEVCLSAGGRLCTRDEHDSLVGHGTGCGLNNQKVWSTTMCRGHNGVGVLVGKGKPDDEPECIPPGSNAVHGVRCCSDVSVLSGAGWEQDTSSTTQEAIGVSTSSLAVIVGAVVVLIGAALVLHSRHTTKTIKAMLKDKTEQWETSTAAKSDGFDWDDACATTVVSCSEMGTDDVGRLMDTRTTDNTQQQEIRGIGGRAGSEVA